MTSEDDVDVTAPLVGRLVAAQCPQWTHLPLARVRSAGTDNVIYRLGDDLAVRMPRRRGAVAMLRNEQRWLPHVAPGLPLAVPVPLFNGVPGSGFPHPWSVYPWLDGEDLAHQPDVDLDDLAVRLGRFVAALRRIDPAGAPPSPRGGSPVDPSRDQQAQAHIRELAGEGVLDADAAAAAWRSVRAAPLWNGEPVWVHADLHPLNVLVRRGRLAGVVDFGLLGLGDPALDLLPAWTMLTARARELFRAEVAVDDGTWARGRAWALWLGLGAVRVYRVANPALAEGGWHAIGEILAEQRAG